MNGRFFLYTRFYTRFGVLFSARRFCNSELCIAILDNTGTAVVTYNYDPWGRLLSTDGTLADTLGKRNPFRYRGYVYDEESGLYCTESRMYNPNLCRFISTDNTDVLADDDDIFSSNLYTYCNNAPTVYADWNGEAVANIVGGIAGGLTGAALGVWVAKKCKLSGLAKVAVITVFATLGVAAGAALGPIVAKLGSKLGAKIAAKIGVRSVPKIGTQIGKLGRVTKNLRPTIKSLGRHGLQRMQERGVSLKMAQKIVRNGTAIAQNGGKTLYFNKTGAVVLNDAGTIVTVYAAKNFDQNMWAVVKMFYR